MSLLVSKTKSALEGSLLLCETVMDTREKNVLIEVKKRHVTPLSYSRHFRSRRFSLALIVSYTVHRGKSDCVKPIMKTSDKHLEPFKHTLRSQEPLLGTYKVIDC